MSVLLKTNELEIGYRDSKGIISIARDINFKLRSGELAAIIGVNGIGKSTLLRTLARIQPPLRGDIEVSGKPVGEYKPRSWARQISVVLTEPLMAKNLSVQELIGLGRYPYTNWLGILSPADKKCIHIALQRMELQDLKDKKCFELSDGQLQKVWIARALAQDTSVILLDEPTTHLDLYHKVQILKLLQNIAHREDKAILFTTHEINLAIQLCDKMLIMESNNNSFGTPRSLIESGHFQALFPADTISFDPESAAFRIR